MLELKDLTAMYWFEYNADEERAAIQKYAMERERAEGRAEGIAKGIAEGREQKMLEMVRNLVKAGTPIQYIEAASGWNEQQIRNAVDA